jgi:hypothetical protein
VLSTGCQWKALPKDLPPKSTAHHYFMLWDWDGTLERFHHRLYVAAREQAGHEASPTAAIIDSQTSKAAQKGALRLTHRASMLPKSPGPAKVVYRALFGFVLPNSTRCYSDNNPSPIRLASMDRRLERR